jgi:hypothetical protein
VKTYRFRTKIWLWEGPAAWHFAPVDADVSAEIRKGQEGKKRIGWGSIPVMATIGKTSWKTSIFPEKKSGCYLLPLKADVRKKEGISANDTVEVRLALEG